MFAIASRMACNRGVEKLEAGDHNGALADYDPVFTLPDLPPEHQVSAHSIWSRTDRYRTLSAMAPTCIRHAVSP